MATEVDGPAPLGWIVNLVTGAGFTKSWTYNPNGAGQPAQNWPAGTAGYAALTFTAAGASAPTFTATWTATVSGTTLTLMEPKTVTDLVPDGCQIDMWINLNDGLGDQPILSGSVVRRL